MKVNGAHYETIWVEQGERPFVRIIDQRFLPFEFRTEDLHTADDFYRAIKEMHVRGAPLIGAAGALGMYMALVNYEGLSDPADYLREKAGYLKSSRPTAVNLGYAVDRMMHTLAGSDDLSAKIAKALETAMSIVDEERSNCLNIGKYGLPLIEELSVKNNGRPVNILTHCNAGWLACIDYGTATAPVYLAHDKGIKLHVWVDETRPLNQGSKLTAWELQQHGVDCTIITDNAGGHLMQHGMVDMVIVGCDRATVNGDAANKIGTYLKALAAKDNNIPFYVALPSSSIDWSVSDGLKEIPIEERDADEIKYIRGVLDGRIEQVRITGIDSRAANYAFDVTPARFITGFITEKGICKPEKNSILELFPEKRKKAAL